MSLPEDINRLKKIIKPDLKYKIGDLVCLKSDLKKHFPMVITNFDLEDYTCSDYYVEWLNSQGNKEHSSFPEECLMLRNNENLNKIK